MVLMRGGEMRIDFDEDEEVMESDIGGDREDFDGD